MTALIEASESKLHPSEAINTQWKAANPCITANLIPQWQKCSQGNIPTDPPPTLWSVTRRSHFTFTFVNTIPLISRWHWSLVFSRPSTQPDSLSPPEGQHWGCPRHKAATGGWGTPDGRQRRGGRGRRRREGGGEQAHIHSRAFLFSPHTLPPPDTSSVERPAGKGGSWEEKIMPGGGSNCCFQDLSQKIRKASECQSPQTCKNKN